ncbi:MAG: Hsp20/alpha crystallin family protein [Deltaproteobacteria bacterium]|nr:Hsp20/alpha crystallin family protein [Deltaproteobacteria bacterium]
MPADNKHLHHVVPLVDIYKTGEGVIVYIDLPGVKKDQIKLNIEDNRLQLVCEKPDERPNLSKGFFHLMEREYGFFRRELVLPSGLQPEKAEAKMDDGVLMVRIPWDFTGRKNKE